MVNNSFLYQYIGGDYWGCTPEGQAHLYIIGYCLNGEGDFCIKYLIYLLS